MLSLLIQTSTSYEQISFDFCLVVQQGHSLDKLPMNYWIFSSDWKNMHTVKSFLLVWVGQCSWVAEVFLVL